MPKEGQTGARLISGELLLEFNWSKDRYQHAFHSGDLVFCSAEAKPWRPPVYTDLHSQGDLLFASGAADHCHWSASIEADGVGVVFDVACRIAKGDRQLGAGYLGEGFVIDGPSIDEGHLDVQSAGNGKSWVFTSLETPTPKTTVRFKYRVRLA